MLNKRVVVCLDIAGGRVVKGVQFGGLQDAGDPVDLAAQYSDDGADELVLLDISATNESRAPMLSLVERVARRVFIPLCVGGGVSDVSTAVDLLRAGADKVSVNSAAIARPELIGEISARLGAQSTVVAIDARKESSGWRVRSHAGLQGTCLDPVDWAERSVSLGAGEILLTSIDTDGTRQGFDVSMVEAVARRVRVPIVASGGAGSAGHFLSVLGPGHASAALGASIFHFKVLSVADVKRALLTAGLPVRWPI